MGCGVCGVGCGLWRSVGFHVSASQYSGAARLCALTNLQVARCVRAVDDGALGVGRPGRLGAKLAAEELRHLSRLAMQRQGHLGHVRNRGLDPVTTALDLALDGRHLITIGRVVHRRGALDVDVTWAAAAVGRAGRLWWRSPRGGTTVVMACPQQLIT